MAHCSIVIRNRRGGPLRSFERTLMLTDAVVAIAMTLLVLPLVDLAPEVAHGGLKILTDRHDVIFGFVVSFLVIYAFWQHHDRAFTGVHEAGPALIQLNMVWMLTVAFLPFPTAIIGYKVTTTTAPLYIGTMLVLKLLTRGIHAGCVACGGRPLTARGVWYDAAVTAVFAACTIIAFFWPSAGLYGLLALIPIGLVVNRVVPDPPTEQAGASPRTPPSPA